MAVFEVKIPGWVSAAGHLGLMPVGIFSGGEKHMFEHASRVYPVYFAFPYRKEDDVTVELPAGWKVSRLPRNQNQNAKAAEYILKIEDKGSTVHLTRTVRSDVVIIPTSSYPVLRQFYQVVRSGDEQQIVLQPGGIAAGN